MSRHRLSKGAALFRVVGSPTPVMPASGARAETTDAASRTRLTHVRVDFWLVAVVGITVAALALRLIAINFGLPYHYYWDEPTIVNRAVRMGSGDLNPHFFYYPALSMYVLFVADAGLYVVGHFLHVYPSVNHFAFIYFTDSTTIYLLGRLVIALASAATVVLCYLVGRRFFSPPVALIGAALLAVAPVQASNAHVVITDVPMALFVLLAYVYIWDVYLAGRLRSYVLAGVAIGLGIATKYFPAILVVTLVLAHGFRIYHERGLRWPRPGETLPLGIGVAVALLAFFFAAPYSILDWHRALHDYQQQSQLTYGGSGLNFLPYLTRTLPWSIGWPAYCAAMAALLAIVLARGERRRQLVLFASFPLLYFLVIGNGHQPFARYLVPLTPFLALGAAAVTWWCTQRASALRGLTRPGSAGQSGLVWSVAAALALLLVVPAAVVSVRYDVYLTHQDTRTQATRWFAQHVPSGTGTAIQSLYNRTFFNAPISTTSQLRKLEGEVPRGRPAVRQAVDRYYRQRPLYPDAPFVYNLGTLRAHGVRYVVLSSLIYHNAAPPVVEDRFYKELAREGSVVARFTPQMDLPDGDLYPIEMPTITIYALP